MTKYEKMYHDIGADIPGTTESKMFGALCLKAENGKAGVMFWKEDMIFKLQGEELDAALKLKGAAIFTPAEGRPMGGWVQVPNAQAAKWPQLAKQAMALVSKIKK